MRILLLYSLMFFIGQSLVSQSFAPAAGFPGSTAIHKDSSAIVAWASEAEIFPGPQDIRNPESEPASFGTAENAVGKAQGNPYVVSLGDGGYAILKFEKPITNKAGPDFAVFENGFRQDTTSYEAFLEFAFVEVSSDCEHFVRFPAISEIPTDVQIGTYTLLDARYVHNLAGKYTAGFGTPFDLEELEGLDSKLDIYSIQCVKIIDAIGSINPEYASYDSFNNLINCPFPTPFASGGFDLDAIAVIHEASETESERKLIVKNPTSESLYFPLGYPEDGVLKIYTIHGTKIYTKQVFKTDSGFTNISLQNGLYIIVLEGNTQLFSTKIIVL